MKKNKTLITLIVVGAVATIGYLIYTKQIDLSQFFSSQDSTSDGVNGSKTDYKPDSDRSGNPTAPTTPASGADATVTNSIGLTKSDLQILFTPTSALSSDRFLQNQTYKDAIYDRYAQQTISLSEANKRKSGTSSPTAPTTTKTTSASDIMKSAGFGVTSATLKQSLISNAKTKDTTSAQNKLASVGFK